MRAEEVFQSLDTLAILCGDSEKAHLFEDRLRHDVLVAIATGAENAKELALAALASTDIQFVRWYA